VSTILKALQRLEQEKESLKPSGPTPVFSRSPDSTGGVAGWFLTPWVKRGAVGVIIIALSLVAFHFYRQSRSYSLKQAIRTNAIKQHAPAARAERNAARASGVAKVPNNATSPSAAAKTDPHIIGVNPNHPQPNLPSISNTEESSIQEQSIQAPVPDTGASRRPIGPSRRPRLADIPVAETPAPQKEAGQTETAPEKSTVKSNSGAETKRASDAFKNVSPLTDGRLKVHAIAWSPSVEERMAVVNNRVIYEGDTVDSFIIVAIRPDDVVVREKGNRLWKVVFGRP